MKLVKDETYKADCENKVNYWTYLNRDSDPVIREVTEENKSEILNRILSSGEATGNIMLCTYYGEADKQLIKISDKNDEK